MNRSTISVIRSRLSIYWQGLEPRNQRALKLAAMALLAVLVWQLGIEPALVQRKKLNTQLPRLREEAEVVLGLLEEATALQKNQTQSQALEGTGPATQPQAVVMTVAGIKQSLQAKGAGEVESQFSEGVWRIQIASIGFANLHAWLTSQRAAGWQVQQIDVERMGSASSSDKVRAVVHLRLVRRAS